MDWPSCWRCHLSPGEGAGEAEKKEPAAGGAAKKAETPEATKEAAPAAEKPAGLVGTIVAVVPESRTLLVDVPLGKEVLRTGAQTTRKAKIEAGGASASLENLKPGSRIRINFRRINTGDETIPVEVLGRPKG